MTLRELGWDEDCARHFAEWSTKTDVVAARVVVEFNYIYRLADERGELDAVLTGRLKHHASRRGDLPAVGDWVAVRRRPGEARGAIVAVLPRRSWFSRKMAGNVTDEQIVAANIDVVFVVMALDADFSPRRLERYLLLAHESRATPVVLLTKPDLTDELAALVAQAAAVSGDVSIHVLSPKANEGLDQIRPYLGVGRTAALLGSSGVGKSTIINRLVGADIQKTRAVRAADSKGRHTTTHRELVTLPGGGVVIDTPGMRELQLWDVTDAVRQTFDDVEQLAAGCHFTDCRHAEEPRCAVKAAVAAGTLPEVRLASYLKLQGELSFLGRQQDERALLDEKRRSKIAGKAMKQHDKLRHR